MGGRLILQAVDAIRQDWWRHDTGQFIANSKNVNYKTDCVVSRIKILILH
jgi:hypothetical protein